MVAGCRGCGDSGGGRDGIGRCQLLPSSRSQSEFKHQRAGGDLLSEKRVLGPRKRCLPKAGRGKPSIPGNVPKCLDRALILLQMTGHRLGASPPDPPDPPGLARTVQLETGRRLESSQHSPSVPNCIFNPRLLSLDLTDPRAEWLQGWMDAWSSHPKRHPLVVTTNACSDRYFSLTQCCY